MHERINKAPQAKKINRTLYKRRYKRVEGHQIAKLNINKILAPPEKLYWRPSQNFLGGALHPLHPLPGRHCWKSECGAGKRKRKWECGAAKVVLACFCSFGKCFSVQDDVYLVYLFMSVLQFLQLN